MTTPRDEERSITRTYRAAIRLGEDFITLEESITLPLDAGDEDIQQAVALGWRIYQAQREALDNQVALVRETQQPPASPVVVRDPDAPASEKQRHYIAALQEDLHWTGEQLATFAYDQGVEIVNMTKGQASSFIDKLKKLAEERSLYPDGNRTTTARADAEVSLITERQLHALIQLAQEHGVDLDTETQKLFGAPANAITSAQAASLLKEWQRQERSIRRTSSDSVP